MIPLRFLYTLSAFSILLMGLCKGDGVFEFANFSAPIRIGSQDGPQAGSNIVALPLVGLASDSLTPIGAPHNSLNSTGVIAPYLVNVSYAGPTDSVFVRIAAWDSTQFGLNFSAVPVSSIGLSDTVRVFLSPAPFQAYQRPPFQLSPVVPVTVPEPGQWLLISIGILVVLITRRRRFFN